MLPSLILTLIILAQNQPQPESRPPAPNAPESTESASGLRPDAAGRGSAGIRAC